MKIAVTGSKGLLGWHTSAHLHAENCAAQFGGEKCPFEIVQIDHPLFQNSEELRKALHKVDAVIHYAGVNREEDEVVEAANPSIATQLVDAIRDVGVTPAIVYANSTHAVTPDTAYGRSKKRAGEILAEATDKFTNLVLPHIFGECARPYYNNVTATLIDKIYKSEEAEINPCGQVSLLHAGAVADIAVDCLVNGFSGTLEPESCEMSVTALYQKLEKFHELYCENIFPDVSNPFDLQLFNAYRSAGYPSTYPRRLKLNKDSRGVLFETAKGGNMSQTFMSTTVPGVTRGDHFHIGKIERFLVTHGEAIIRLRKVLTDELVEFRVSGEEPVAIDMIPLHTHSIENVGEGNLQTFFWTHEMFDVSKPDTYADPVLI